MKKVIALIVCVIMVCTLSLTAFAVVSPTEDQSGSGKALGGYIVIGNTIIKEGSVAKISKSGELVLLKANLEKYKAAGNFVEIKIYKRNTSNNLFEEVDPKAYNYQSGDKNNPDSSVVLNDLGDYVFCFNYEKKTFDPNNPDIWEEKSPKDGDTDLTVAFFMMLLGAVAVLGTKKVLSK